MKRKFIILLAAFLLSDLTSNGGLIFDDPIEVRSDFAPHLLAKDEIKFKPTGKCSTYLIVGVEVTLELTYSTGTRKLFHSQKWWSASEPLVFALPDNLEGLQSYRLTGKFAGTPVVPTTTAYTGDVQRDWKSIKGYKSDIDLKWIVK